MFAGGPLAFPVTPFDDAGAVDIATFRRHLRWLLDHKPPVLFVACGTGEFSSLDTAEVAELVSAAVEEAGSDVPVIAGTGHGYRVAQRTIQAAAGAGAKGFLVLPPYLVSGEQGGLFGYYRDLAASTDLPIVLYQRDTAIFEPETVQRLAAIENIVGLKDGLGDIERMQRIVSTVGSALEYFNGMPTAETFQAAYTGLNVPHYSSAVFNFVPEVSWAFYKATSDGDGVMLSRLLRDFFVPFAAIRNRVRGYAVALVKAGVALRCGSVGAVRPPLVNAREEDVRALADLIKNVEDLLT